MAVTETSRAASRAVDDLFRQHGGEVYRYALAVLGNHADAEDVTQTTFLNAYRAIEQGVKPRKPSNWLLAIASNAIKQRFRQENARPQQVTLDDEIAGTSTEDDGPTVGELLTALSRIPPQQRQAIVLREFEGRTYKEIADILGVTTSALETLLFRARRSLADELAHQLTCTEAQLAISRATDGRLGRKERRRLREHLGECPDCARFARLQQRHRTALRGLMLVPIPVSLSLLRGLEGTASAAMLPVAAAGTGASAVGAGAGAAAALGTGAGVGSAGAAGGGVFAGGVAVKAAAVVTAATVAGGVGVVGAKEIGPGNSGNAPGRPAMTDQGGARLGQVAPRGASVPGKGVARGKPSAPGQTQAAAKAARQGQAKAMQARGQGAANARQSQRPSGPSKSPTVKSSAATARSKAAPTRTAATERKAAPTKGASASSTSQKTSTQAKSTTTRKSQKTVRPATGGKPSR